MSVRTMGLAVAVAAAGLVVCGCKPAGGGAPFARQSGEATSDQALHRIPLGAPPGEPTSVATSVQNPLEGDAQAVAQGKALFSQMNCVYCHGAQGSGLMGPALNAPGWRYGGTPAQIYNSIHDGRPKGMPAWGERLPPDQIWRLVAYIESLGGAKPPATAKMVAIGGAQPSTTGAQVAGQSQTDTAQESLTRADQQQSGR